MPRTETLNKVPTAEVGSLVDGFIADGAEKVQVSKNPNEGWDIKASFP